MIGLSEPEKSGGPRPPDFSRPVTYITLQSGGEGQIMPTLLNTKYFPSRIFRHSYGPEMKS